VFVSIVSGRMKRKHRNACINIEVMNLTLCLFDGIILICVYVVFQSTLTFSCFNYVTQSTRVAHSYRKKNHSNANINTGTPCIVYGRNSVDMVHRIGNVGTNCFCKDVVRHNRFHVIIIIVLVIDVCSRFGKQSDRNRETSSKSSCGGGTYCSRRM
jgi:hypothetical protein